MFCRARLLLSYIDELSLIGSRWSRFIARSVEKSSFAETPSQSTQQLPFITLIPTLHVASKKFYDKVLDYMLQATRTRENVVVLLEGICDSDEVEVQQMEEYFAIARSEELRNEMLRKADENTIYSADTVKTICEELAVKYEVLQELHPNVRLQECYLKPKMAALVGSYLRNDADVNMKEVGAILSEAGEGDGQGGEVFISISKVGAHSEVRRTREQKVARAAQMRCVEWVRRGCGGEVILPWGFYHAEGIRHHILAMNANDDGVVFVEENNKLCCVSFGISKELLE